MPKYDKAPAPTMQGRGSNKMPLIKEPRCKVCQSPHRTLVDQMLVAGLSYSEIERQFGFANIPRRSIANHKDSHLGYEEAAIREVIERSAIADQKNYDEGVQRLVTKNAYLEVALQKGYDALVKNETMVEPKDAVKIIEQLQKLQDQNQGEALDELRVQFQMFMQSVKELVARDRWEDIVTRTADLLRASGRTVDWDRSDEETEKTPAQVVAELQEVNVVEAEVVV